MTLPPFQIRRLAVAIFMVVVSFLPYLNSMHGPWLLDDIPLIARNPMVQRLSLWPSLLTTDYWAVRGAPSGVYRPVPMLTFALNRWAFGSNPVLFHITNLMLNAAVCLLLWRVLLRGAIHWLSAAATLWFALHPGHVEAVANIVGRSEILVALFFLAAWAIHTRPTLSGRPCLLLLEAACWLLIALSKENGVPLLALPLLAWFVAPARDVRNLFLRTAPAIAAGLVYAALRIGLGIGTPDLPDSYASDERFELIASATAKNLQLLSGFFTHRAVYTVPEMFSTTLLATGAIAFVGLIAIPAALILRRSALAVPAAAFALSLVTLLQIYPNTVWVWERGLYMPSLALAWLAVEGSQSPGRNLAVPARTFFITAVAILLGYYAYHTTQFSWLYSSEQRFWTHEFKQNPHHLPTIISYSDVLLRTGDLQLKQDALRLRIEAVSANSDSGFAYSALASAALQVQDKPLAEQALTSASLQRLQFPSAVQRRQGYRSLAALANQTGLPKLQQHFLHAARTSLNAAPANQ